MREDSQNDGGTDRSGVLGGPSLYLVATPIGNLEDITLRALRVLKEVDLIACEDTRQTLKLLSHYGIQTRLVSYHEHNEMTKAAELIVNLEGGSKIALVTDAGMPGISDPGFRLIALAIRHHVPVVPIPGASAFLAALVASGLALWAPGRSLAAPAPPTRSGGVELSAPPGCIDAATFAARLSALPVSSARPATRSPT